jgi:hypothetical protein
MKNGLQSGSDRFQSMRLLLPYGLFSKEPSLLPANDQHSECKPLRGGELLHNSSGTESWRGGVAIL